MMSKQFAKYYSVHPGKPICETIMAIPPSIMLLNLEVYKCVTVRVFDDKNGMIYI